MALHSSAKQALSALSISLLLSSCATSSNPEQSQNQTEPNDSYWYCAPGNNQTWRCSESKQSLGLSYYRFWKTTLDLEAEAYELKTDESNH